MTIEAHLETLKERHQKLEEEIRQKESAVGTSDEHLSFLKKERLKIKEEIEALRQKNGI